MIKTGLPSHEFKPLTEQELKLVWQWRNSPRIQQNMHNNQMVKWQAHCNWFKGLQKDSSRQFYILWQNQRPIGVLNFSGVDTATPEWGCYLGETNVWPGSGIVLELAALDYIASHKQYTHLLAQVLSFNTAANKMHKIFEYKQVSQQAGAERDGQKFDILFYRYELKQWLVKRETILTKLPKNIRLLAAHIQFLQ
ncbi:UDP-4-amino-4,6-dideoxy-N-acetyl-beta-L-altrosamine N-acetyltransferase [Paraglaciecola sp. L3A3]|uniref:UDP-4-amino-4, 6-dideoxy-N-acetyl-beta-L-altrosamine N-acetyltransferase n=1 Tax=Paraglaciecola sp. L3A3 TaxID=2686358 RepID=UPI001E464501|nr:UDP-4-amino-4,6-dideoxy-N-acetyl-beta-L-altrosamine N-acetyltransferase [Paraglaciecola sp. L3A3]